MLAIILRFYKFGEFVTFLGDQGRDAIIIKRIVTLEHFPAIGAPSSLGQIFLGPFYYYLISPFLLLFNFNPVGPAFGVAFISIGGIITSYFVIKKEINYLTALVFLVFASFSTVNVQFSRFSWNPNLLPVFSFLTIYFFYKTLAQKNKLHALLFGAFLSFSIQLHHLAILLFLPITSIYLYYFIRHSGKRGTSASRIVVQNELRFRTSYNPFRDRNDIINLTLSFGSFLFFSLPLLIFDLRHNFLNTRNIFNFFLVGNPTDRGQFFARFLETNKSFYSYVFQINFNTYLAFLITAAFIIFIFRKFQFKKYLFIYINLLVFISYLFFFSFFNTIRNPHYYNSIYFSFFLLLAWTITNILKTKLIKLLALLFVVLAYIFLNLKSLSYLFYAKGNNQIKKAEIIAESILQKVPQIPFQTIALPYVETDGHIRYYLEIKGKRPLPADTLQEPLELYVLCFEKDCQVLGNPQWQIASFKDAEVDKIWTVEGVKIYKLIHNNSLDIRN